jgi:hypothetical protein
VSRGFLGVDFVGDEGGSGIDEFEVESWICSSSLFSDEISVIFLTLSMILLRENSPLKYIGIGVMPSRRGLALYGNLILRLNAELGELNSTPFRVKHMAGDCGKISTISLTDLSCRVYVPLSTWIIWVWEVESLRVLINLINFRWRGQDPLLKS